MVCSLTVQRKKPSCITHMAFTSGRCDTSPLLQEKQINCGSLLERGKSLNRYEFLQEGMHDCAENAHFHDPGPWNGSFRPPLASPWAALGTGTAVSILLAPRFPPSDRKSTRLNSSHQIISYAVFCLKKKKTHPKITPLLPHHPLDPHP